MDTETDLTAADRAVLIAIIAELQVVVERLERRIAELEGQAKPGGPPRIPGLKPKANRKPSQPKPPRNPRRHGFARARMTPTHRVEHVWVEHVMENCPDCGTHRSGGWTQRTREVIDLPAVPVQVTAARPRREWSINYRRYHMKRTQRDLIVLTASIGIGVGLGMLLSPRSGREARDLLQTTANQAVDRGRDYWQRMRTRGSGAEVVAVVEAES